MSNLFVPAGSMRIEAVRVCWAWKTNPKILPWPPAWSSFAARSSPRLDTHQQGKYSASLQPRIQTLAWRSCHAVASGSSKPHTWNSRHFHLIWFFFAFQFNSKRNLGICSPVLIFSFLCPWRHVKSTVVILTGHVIHVAIGSSVLAAQVQRVLNLLFCGWYSGHFLPRKTSRVSNHTSKT